MQKKAAFEMETIVKFLLAIIVIVIIIAIILILKGKSVSLLDYIKNILRFG